MPAAVATRTVPALSLLSMNPSPAIVQSAQTSAGSRHGLINLTRLVHSLERGGHDSTWLQVQKTWETVLYAKALLDALRGGNEQASTTASALDELEHMLARAEVEVQSAAKRAKAPAPTVSLPLLDLPSLPGAPVALLDETVPAKLELDDDALAAADLPSPPLMPPSPRASRASRSPSAPLMSPMLLASGSSELDTAKYFAKRRREDESGGEAGLVPLKTRRADGPMDEEGMRNRLMGGVKTVVGSSQLHEELGGQLADMSHRLKLNAIHFSNSLEEEKSMLETSQDVLEKNLESTKASKGTLSKVSTKGRSTTCMTIGVVVLVILLFIWTVLLMRFT